MQTPAIKYLVVRLHPTLRNKALRWFQTNYLAEAKFWSKLAGYQVHTVHVRNDGHRTVSILGDRL